MSILTSVVPIDSEEFGTAQTYRVTDGQTEREAYAINKMDFHAETFVENKPSASYM